MTAITTTDGGPLLMRKRLAPLNEDADAASDYDQ
jgi:hypothetical protein